MNCVSAFRCVGDHRFTGVRAAHFGDAFITHLFEIVEATRDGDELYNYAVVRLIVRLQSRITCSLLIQQRPDRS